jgi:hypothetical protein
MVNDPLTATYYPFTAMAPSVANILSCCFGRVAVYQPVGALPLRGLQPWIDNGFLDIRIPFAGITDATVLASEFANWKAWGSMHENGDLAYFARLGKSLAPVTPLTPQVAAAIKGTAGKTEPKTDNCELTIQLFLLLAQDFDQQSLDIQEQLDHIEKQKQALEDFFRIDSFEERSTATPVARDGFAQANEDLGNFMTESRMVAWNHLFQKAPARSGVLITNSQAALDFLLEDLAETVTVGHFPISYPLETSGNSPLKGHLGPLLKALLTKPWDDQLRRHVEEVGNRILGATAWKQKPPEASAQGTATFHWYLVPNLDTAALLKKQCQKGQGPQKEPGNNTVLGLLKTDVPGHDT